MIWAPHSGFPADPVRWSGAQMSKLSAPTVQTSGSGRHRVEISWCEGQLWRPDLERYRDPDDFQALHELVEIVHV